MSRFPAPAVRRRPRRAHARAASRSRRGLRLMPRGQCVRQRGAILDSYGVHQVSGCGRHAQLIPSAARRIPAIRATVITRTDHTPHRDRSHVGTPRNLLPQGGLEDLAGRALRQLGHEPDLARVLVGGQALPAVGDDVLGAHLAPVAPDHDRHHLPPPPSRTRSSGLPMTAASAIPGWAYRTSSISRGYTLNPPRMTRSLARSTSKKKPYWSKPTTPPGSSN